MRLDYAYYSNAQSHLDLDFAWIVGPADYSNVRSLLSGSPKFHIVWTIPSPVPL
jgi:hypothetical protein